MSKKTGRQSSRRSAVATRPAPQPETRETSRRFEAFAGEYLWLVVGVIVTAILAEVDAPVILRSIFGLPVVLFIPGYIIAGILFPLREPVDGLERVALSVGLSIAVVSVVVIILEYLPSWISSASVISALLVVTIPGAIAATVRRARVPSEDRYAPSLRRATARPQLVVSSIGRLLVGATVLALLLFGLGAALIIRERLNDEPLTELALLTEDGQTQLYDRQVTIGVPETVLLEVTNREGKTVEYQAVARSAGVEVGRADHVVVESGSSIRVPLTFQLSTGGERVPVDFDLYRLDQADSATPYRSVTLVVTATEP